MEKLITNKSIPGDKFTWPEFADDKTRIKTNSRKYKNKSIIEAFEGVYGVDLNNVNKSANSLPREYGVGDVIKTKILGVNKDSVIFDDINYKGTVSCSVNLYKYKGLRDGKDEEIDAVVTDAKKGKITIDPIKPMTVGWINKVIKNPEIQCVMGFPQTIKVKGLQLTNGGFTGKAVIPTTSEFVGDEVVVDAFIPGSQIVLNITEDFEQFIGKDVDAFVVNYIPRGEGMSLICSRKNYLTFLGQETMIELFNRWCEGNDAWMKASAVTYKGKVTGVINSSKKCGVFVEITELNITGMVKVGPDELVNYKPGDEVMVKLDSFDEELSFNKITQQMEHVEPYVIEEDVLKKCNIKPILAFVK